VTLLGIPLFAENDCSEEAAKQRVHYNENFVKKYTDNLNYPHTQEYMAYLDRVFKDQVNLQDLESIAEICCGHGEMSTLFGSQIGSGIGLDISPAMLAAACQKHQDVESMFYIQGDATRLPLGDGEFKSVFMLGGIHHVSDRARLFSEIYRILQPGGRFFFREPVSDFFLWRWIRAMIYRISPALDASTERPLLWSETIPALERAGLRLRTWNTYGFLGFCLFMNSDVLVFNRLFRYLPGVRAITKLFASFDDFIVRLPGLRHAGLQVIGVAEKPQNEAG
jgi:ubiquinone/menaquinone biosynthesis C-methylase UbiE